MQNRGNRHCLRLWCLFVGLNRVEESVAHSSRSLPTLCRILCKRTVDDLANGWRNLRRTLQQRNGWLLEDGADGVVDAAVLTQIQREALGQQTVSCHADCINNRLR